MKIYGRVRILFIFFLAAETSFCQPGVSSDTLTPLISYKHFGEEDGLHCKSVYEVIQDKDGFLWFATDAGAFRFDGKTFRQYNIENGVTDKEVLKVFQDSYGRVWFLTLNGHLSFWKDGKIYNPSNTPFLKKAYTGSSIFSYYEDTRNRMWLGTAGHSFILIDADSVRVIQSLEGYSDSARMGSIYIYEDAGGNTWTFNKNTMFRFPDNQSGDTLLIPPGGRDGFACHKNKSAEMFYLDPKVGMYKMSDKSVSLFVDKKEIPFISELINIVYDKGNLWFCTRGKGCSQIVNGKFFKRYLEDKVVASVFTDRENNIWFNTMGQGVYMLPSGAGFVKNYNHQSGLSADNVTALALGKEHEFWLGYTNNTVEKIKFNKATIFTLDAPGNHDFNRVMSLATDSDKVFCGTDGSINVIYKDKVQIVQVDTPHSAYSVKQLFISKRKKVYATHASGFLEITENNGRYYANDPIDSIIRTFAIAEYMDNRFLISTENGLMEYSGGKDRTTYKTDIDFSSIRILDMKPVPVNLLALATNGNGIYFLKGKKLYQHVSTSDGLPDNNCKRIFVSDSAMYVSTDKGLSVLINANGKWSVSGVITTKDGLMSNTVNDAAERGGIIYVATEKGLSLFDRTAVSRKKFVGKVYVTEIVSDSVHAVADSSYSFKSDIPRLLIRFACPVFDPANDPAIKYRMLQSSTDNPVWISSVNDEIEFSSLNPGQYIFQLKPDIRSVSDAAVTSIYINIIPMWWQTNAARIGFALLVIGLVILIVRRRIQLQYKKQVAELRQLEAERSRIASDMHDDIGADLTQLSIWSGILKSSEKQNKEVLSRITQSTNEVLQKMEQIIWALNSFQNHTTDLISYLREYASQYLESADINLSFEIPDAMPELAVSAIQKRNIFLTVKELLHNTVKHSGAKNVSIKIYTEQSFLNIEYKDDGKGFTAKEKEEGMGNITVQKRMKEINSTISVKSSPGNGFSAQLKIKLAVERRN